MLSQNQSILHKQLHHTMHENFVEWLFHKKTLSQPISMKWQLSSDGSNEVENCPISHRQQQVLIFDQFHEPLLAYTNCM